MMADLEDFWDDDEDMARFERKQDEALKPTPTFALSPCPFCGSSDAFVERADFTGCYVMCNYCQARGPIKCQDGDDEETPGAEAAMKAWNARAPAPPHDSKQG